MNEFTTVYWNSYPNWIFRSSKYRNRRNKTEALVLLKKRDKKDTFVILKLVFGLLYLSAIHRICIPAGAIVSATHTPN